MASQLIPKRILVVDDNIDAAELIAELLAYYGHQTTTAYDGSQGIQAALTFRPDVVLVDLGMPVIDGFEMAARLRKMPELGNLVLIAYTAWNDVATKGKTSRGGFDAHIAKPSSIDVLLKAIEETRQNHS